MTPSGIEPATFRFAAQYLNHCAIAVPPNKKIEKQEMQATFWGKILIED
jgi:hypothetical protein